MPRIVFSVAFNYQDAVDFHDVPITTPENLETALDAIAEFADETLGHYAGMIDRIGEHYTIDGIMIGNPIPA